MRDRVSFWHVGHDLSVPPTRKYESEGSPDMRDILALLRGSDTPDADRASFLQAAMVFWLIGATDGHAKNFSVLARAGRPIPAGAALRRAHRAAELRRPSDRAQGVQAGALGRPEPPLRGRRDRAALFRRDGRFRGPGDHGPDRRRRVEGRPRRRRGPAGRVPRTYRRVGRDSRRAARSFSPPRRSNPAPAPRAAP